MKLLAKETTADGCWQLTALMPRVLPWNIDAWAVPVCMSPKSLMETGLLMVPK